MLRLLVVVFLVIIISPMIALSDGMPIDENGRFTGGPTTIITLTESQLQILSIPEKRFNRIPLSEAQRAKLKKETGKSPSLFVFYDTRIGDNDCTCGAANRAFRFSELKAEIPHAYLVTDEEAAQSDKDHGL